MKGQMYTCLDMEYKAIDDFNRDDYVDVGDNDWIGRSRLISAAPDLLFQCDLVLEFDTVEPCSILGEDESIHKIFNMTLRDMLGFLGYVFNSSDKASLLHGIVEGGDIELPKSCHLRRNNGVTHIRMYGTRVPRNLILD